MADLYVIGLFVKGSYLYLRITRVSVEDKNTSAYLRSPKVRRLGLESMLNYRITGIASYQTSLDSKPKYITTN